MGDKFLDYDRLEGKVEEKLKKIKADPAISEHNKELVARYIQDAMLGKTIKKGQKKKLGAGRILQSTGYLMLMCKEWFKKDLDKVTQKDMERFILDLDQGKITTVKNKAGRPYKSETKSNIKKFIRKFYKWLQGNGYTYPSLVDWIDTSKKPAEIKAIPGLLEGVKEIVAILPDTKRKAMTMVGFDSGFRLGELVNLTVGDVEKGDDGTYYITCRHSKTRPRTVSLPYSSEILDKWLKEHPYKDDRNAQLWQTSRQFFYNSVILYGKKALGIHVHPHMLRHTSATFYAPKIERTTFCKRFGWAYSSKMPDNYIEFAQVEEKKIVDIVKTEKYAELRDELSKEKEQRVFLQDQLKAMKEEMDTKLETIQRNAISTAYNKLIKKLAEKEKSTSV